MASIVSSIGFADEASTTVTSLPTVEQLDFFERSVRPLLSEHCFSCHSSKAKKVKANLLVDSRAGLLRGGDSGAAIQPGDPENSLLLAAVRYESYEMPPKGKLPSKDVETLERWVAMEPPGRMKLFLKQTKLRANSICKSVSPSTGFGNQSSLRRFQRFAIRDGLETT